MLTRYSFLLLLLSAQAWAAGFEKSIMWGGRSAGIAGIAAPYVQGSQALYFNPAGLVSENQGSDISFNMSPTFAQFSGPLESGSTEITSARDDVLPLSLLWGNTLSDQWGYGFGFYTSGGAHADFGQVDFPGAPEDAKIRTDLAISELALGAGLRVDDKLKVGLAYRVVMASGSFGFVDRNGPAVINTEVNGIKDIQYTGFKFGAQYKASEQTQWSFTYRSAVAFNADGKFGGQIIAPAVSQVEENDAKIKTTFPVAVTIGMQHECNESWRAYLEYVWTQYSAVDKIKMDGTLQAGAFTIKNPEVETDWKDQHNLRVGAEYKGWMLPLRMGYVFTSQVTPNDRARPSFTAPGIGHTLTVGSGMALGTQVQIDGGLEYSVVSGNGYQSDAIALHLGLITGF